MLSQASEMFINRITTYKQKLERKTLQEIVIELRVISFLVSISFPYFQSFPFPLTLSWITILPLTG